MVHPPRGAERGRIGEELSKSLTAEVCQKAFLQTPDPPNPQTGPLKLDFCDLANRKKRE